MILPETSEASKGSERERLSRRPVRAGRLWTRVPKDRQARIQRIGGEASASPSGNFFNSEGMALRGPNGEPLTDGAFSSSSISRLFQITAPLSDREESDRPYEENPWVRAAIKAIKAGFQRLDFCLYDGDPKDKASKKIERHPLLDLLADPNQLMTEREFWEAHAVDMKHDGEQVWFLTDIDGRPLRRAGEPGGSALPFPTQIVPVRGKLVDVECNAMGLPRVYRYNIGAGQRSGGSDQMDFPPDSVLHFRGYDPYTPLRGLGDVDALVRETDLYFQTFRSMDGAVRNGGDPGGFIIFKTAVGYDELQRRQDEADETMSGPNSSRYKMLDGDAKFVANFVKPSDMQYREMAEWLRESILSVLGVPPPVIGLFDDATYNNVETAYRELFTGPNGILSLGAATADVVTNKFLRRFASVSGEGRVEAYFDPSSIEALQDDSGDKVKLAAEIAAIGTGITFNEALEMWGAEVEPAKEGNRSWVSTNLTDWNDPQAGKPATPEPKEAKGEDEEDQDNDSKAGKAKKEKAGTRPGVTLATLAEEDFIEPDERLEAISLKWLSAFEREQRGILRRIANRGLRRLSILDEPVDLSNLTEEQWDALLLAEEPWAIRFNKEIRVALRDIFMTSVGEAFEEVSQRGLILTQSHPDVIRLLADQRIRVSEGVTSVTAKRVKDELAKVFSGLSEASDLREAIKESLPELNEGLTRAFGSKEARAATIAQTETATASNVARYAQYQNSEVVEIQWVSRQLPTTRDTHRELHLKKIPMGGTFSNGMLHPQDPSGPAKERVNCGCKFRATKYRNPLDDLE